MKRSVEKIAASFRKLVEERKKPNVVKRAPPTPATKISRNERRKQWNRDNKARQLATQRAYYAKHKERIRERKYEQRKGKPKARGLIGAERDYRRGNIALDELNRRYSEASRRIDERFNYELAVAIGETLRTGSRKRSVQLRKTNVVPDATKTRCNKNSDGDK